MHFISRVGAIVLAISASVFFLIATINNSIEQVLLDRETYVNTFQQEAIFNDLLPITLPALIEIAEDQQIRDFPIDLSNAPDIFDREDWQYITNELVPPTWLEERFFDSVDILLGSVEGDTSILDRELDFSEIRERFEGPVANDVATYIISNAPVCTRTENDRIRSVASGMTETLPICNPGAPNDQLLISAITTSFNAIGQNLPESDQSSVREIFQVNEGVLYIISLLIQIDAQVLLLFYIFPLALCSLIVWLAVRSFKSFGYWLAFVTILSGILILIAIVFIQVNTFSAFTEIDQATNDLERLFTIIFINFAATASNALTSILIFQAGLYLGVGFIAFIFSNVIGGNTDESDGFLLANDSMSLTQA